MAQSVASETTLYDLGVGADGKTLKSPRLLRASCAALLADANLGASVVPPEGAVLTAGGHCYSVCAASATDHHLTTAGGLKLKALPRGGAIELEALGAPNDATTDISDLIETAMTMDADILFPRRFAIGRSIRFAGTARRFLFPNSAVTLLPGGAFDDVITHGSGADTGFDVVFNLGTESAGCKRCLFEGCVTLGATSNASGKTGLVLWAASRLGAAHTNDFRVKTYLGARGFAYAFLGQGTTAAVAGSLTGSTIAYVETGNGIGAFNLALNQDDIQFDTIRDRGKSVLSTSARVGEYYMYGTDATKATDGVSLGSFATLDVAHHFIEGAFRHPVLLNGDNNQYIASVRVSSNFDSSAGQVVTVNTNDCHVRITEEPQGRQGAHSCYARRASPGSRGLFEFFLTTAQGEADFKEPIVFSGTAATEDTVIVHDTRRSYRGRYGGAALSYRHIDPVALTLHDQAGRISGYVQPRGEAALAVANGGRYALYDRDADLIVLEAAAKRQIRLYGAPGRVGPLEVTLVASGADITILADSTGPILFARGAASVTLLGGRRSAITLRWSPLAAAWIEVSRQERSALDPVSAAEIASAAAGVNTAGKRAGLMVWDSTNNRAMVASGGGATAPWYLCDGSASVTPS